MRAERSCGPRRRRPVGQVPQQRGGQVRRAPPSPWATADVGEVRTSGQHHPCTASPARYQPRRMWRRLLSRTAASIARSRHPCHSRSRRDRSSIVRSETSTRRGIPHRECRPALHAGHVADSWTESRPSDQKRLHGVAPSAAAAAPGGRPLVDAVHRGDGRRGALAGGAQAHAAITHDTPSGGRGGECRAGWPPSAAPRKVTLELAARIAGLARPVAWVRARSRGITATDVATLTSREGDQACCRTQAHRGQGFSGKRVHGARASARARDRPVGGGDPRHPALHGALHVVVEEAPPGDLDGIAVDRVRPCHAVRDQDHQQVAARGIPRNYTSQIWWQAARPGRRAHDGRAGGAHDFVPVDDDAALRLGRSRARPRWKARGARHRAHRRAVPGAPSPALRTPSPVREGRTSGCRAPWHPVSPSAPSLIDTEPRAIRAASSRQKTARRGNS